MKFAVFLILIALSEASPAFRCGSQLVSEGDTRYEVETICGLPDDVSTYTYFRSLSNREVVDCEPVRIHTVESLNGDSDEEAGEKPRSCLALVENRLAVEVNVELWLYDRGRNRFIQQVHFENGRVTRIEKLDYGRKPRR